MNIYQARCEVSEKLTREIGIRSIHSTLFGFKSFAIA